ncbi:MAG: WXG100 family type VII secretion target [Chloroflexi bacterium]|nr:WXG100 family type VII secretion target [Ktedonobacteraceae bacterium]MBV9707458.1 WXG100 family type VII secretion target [Chloroflexota bacterium]
MSYDDTFQASPDDLWSTAPKFQAAGDAIRGVARSLNIAITNASSSWDGEGQKQINRLGKSVEENLKALADALDEIGTCLHKGATLIDTTETNNRNRFQNN